MTIRKADTADAEQLHDLYSRHLTTQPPEQPQDMEVWRSKIERFHSDPMYHILVGEVDGRVVSSVTLVVIENLTRNLRPYALVENVVTHSEHRGNGYAKMLMARAAEIAEQHGCYKIMLLTSGRHDGVLQFYESCGFNRSDKTGFVRWV